MFDPADVVDGGGQGLGQQVPLSDAEQQRVGVEGDEPRPRMDCQRTALMSLIPISGFRLAAMAA